MTRNTMGITSVVELSHDSDEDFMLLVPDALIEVVITSDVATDPETVMATLSHDDVSTAYAILIEVTTDPSGSLQAAAQPLTFTQYPESPKRHVPGDLRYTWAFRSRNGRFAHRGFRMTRTCRGFERAVPACGAALGHWLGAPDVALEREVDTVPQ